jgi:hypothetical protein
MIGHDGVHHRRRLIVQDALRLCGHGPGDRHRALIPGRQVGRISIPGPGDVHHLKKPVDDVFFVLRVVVLS